VAALARRSAGGARTLTVQRRAGRGARAAACNDGGPARMRGRAARSDGRPSHGARYGVAGGRQRRRDCGALPDDCRRLFTAYARGRSDCAPIGSIACGKFPVHARGRPTRSGAGARARDLSQHGRGSRVECVDVRVSRHHVDRLGPGLGSGRRGGRAQGSAARRRAGTRARHGVRDRRRCPRRGGPAAEDRGRREADALRPPCLSGAGSAR